MIEQPDDRFPMSCPRLRTSLEPPWMNSLHIVELLLLPLILPPFAHPHSSWSLELRHKEEKQDLRPVSVPRLLFHLSQLTSKPTYASL